MGWLVFKLELNHTVSTTICLLTSVNSKANKHLNVLTNSTAILDVVKVNALYSTNTNKVGHLTLKSLNVPKQRLGVIPVFYKVH